MRRCLAVATVALGLLVAPPVAPGLVLREKTSRSMSFAGAGCGDSDSATLRVPSHARSVRFIGPKAGAMLESVASSADVAQVTSVRRSGRTFTVTAKGAGDVCTHPESYADGWETEPVPAVARFRRSHPVRAFYNCRTKRQRPQHVIVACGDGNFQLLGMHWSRWGGRVAFGRGQALYNTCIPYCAAGDMRRTPVRVRYDHVRRCATKGGLYYSRLVWVTKFGRYGTSFGWLCR